MFSIPEQFLVGTVDLVYKTYLNYEGFGVTSGAGPESFLNDFLHELGTAAGMKDPCSGWKRVVSHLTPEEMEKLTSDGELSLLLSGPSSGALFSRAHHFLCHLYFSDGDTVKWEFLGEPCCSWSEPGWERGVGIGVDVTLSI